MKAYGDFRRRSQARVLYIEPAELHTVERALSRFRRLLGASTDWESLWRFLPDDLGAGIVAKSAIAATFAAGLELVREGRLSLRQDAAFGPIYLRAAPAPAAIVDGREPEGDERRRRQHLRLLEALLFASRAPVPVRELTARLPEGADVDRLLAKLADALCQSRRQPGQRGGTWGFRTAPDLAAHLAGERVSVRKLSRAAVETLAIVAYHQPVTRSEIEEIRGVGLSKGTLDILFEAGWVRPRGRRRTPGRPVTWATTDAFLDHFGLESLAELPGVDELKAAGLLEMGPVVADARASLERGPPDDDEGEDGEGDEGDVGLGPDA